MIPFCRNDLGEEEIRAVSSVIKDGWVAPGPIANKFEAQFAEYVGSKHAVFIDSGTAALYLAVAYLKHLGIFTNKVHVPSLTFVATAEAVAQNNLTPVFDDISVEDFCLHEGVENSIAVHLTGNRSHRDALIYDSAHRIEKNDVKGSSALWCYSFYATKNITTIQGGMIATNNKDAAEWFKKARDHGLTKGTKERYEGRNVPLDCEFIGWRVKADDVRATIGIEQLKKLPLLNEKRNKVVARYNESLKLNRKGNHVYPVLVEDRDRFINFMLERGIQCVTHFKPIHTFTAYRRFFTIPLPNTEFVGERIVSLPIYPSLTEKEQNHIIDNILEYRQGIR